MKGLKYIFVVSIVLFVLMSSGVNAEISSVKERLGQQDYDIRWDTDNITFKNTNFNISIPVEKFVVPDELNESRYEVTKRDIENDSLVISYKLDNKNYKLKIKDKKLDKNDKIKYKNGITNITLSNHYNKIVVDYSLEGENYTDVYEKETELLPTINQVEKNENIVTERVTFDNLYGNETNKVLILANNPDTEVINIDFDGLEQTTCDKDYSYVETELDENNLSNKIYHPENYEFHCYNITYPADSNKTIEIDLKEPEPTIFDNKINDYDYYTYLVGSISSFKVNSISEWNEGIHDNTTADSVGLVLRMYENSYLISRDIRTLRPFNDPSSSLPEKIFMGVFNSDIVLINTYNGTLGSLATNSPTLTHNSATTGEDSWYYNSIWSNETIYGGGINNYTYYGLDFDRVFKHNRSDNSYFYQTDISGGYDFRTIEVVEDNAYVSYRKSISGTIYYWIAKLDPNGNTLWEYNLNEVENAITFPPIEIFVNENETHLIWSSVSRDRGINITCMDNGGNETECDFNTNLATSGGIFEFDEEYWQYSPTLNGSFVIYGADIGSNYIRKMRIKDDYTAMPYDEGEGDWELNLGNGLKDVSLIDDRLYVLDGEGIGRINRKTGDFIWYSYNKFGNTNIRLLETIQGAGTTNSWEDYIGYVGGSDDVHKLRFPEYLSGTYQSKIYEIPHDSGVAWNKVVFRNVSAPFNSSIDVCLEFSDDNFTTIKHTECSSLSDFMHSEEGGPTEYTGILQWVDNLYDNIFATSDYLRFNVTLSRLNDTITPPSIGSVNVTGEKNNASYGIVNSPLNDSFYGPDVDFNVTYIDPNGAVGNVKYYWNNDTLFADSGNLQSSNWFNHIESNLSEGDYYWYYVTNDGYNDTTSDTYHFEVTEPDQSQIPYRQDEDNGLDRYPLYFDPYDGIYNQEVPFYTELSVINNAPVVFNNWEVIAELPQDRTYQELYDPEGEECPNTDGNIHCTDLVPTPTSLSWEINEVSADTTQYWDIYFNTTGLTNSITNYTAPFEGRTSFIKEINSTRSETEIKNIHYITDVQSTASLKLYLNGTEVTNDEQYEFNTIDELNDGTIDKVEWISPNPSSFDRWKIVGVVGEPIEVETSTSILNEPVKEGANVLWEKGYKFINKNDFSVDYNYKARLPLDATNIELDGEPISLKIDSQGGYIPINRLLPSNDNLTAYIQYTTRPLDVSLERYPPDIYYVDERASNQINVSITNDGENTLTNIERQITIVYGNDFKLYKDGELIEERETIKDYYNLKIDSLEPATTERYRLEYETDTASLVDSKDVDSNIYQTKYYDIVSHSPTPLDPLRLRLEDIPCNGVVNATNLEGNVEYDIYCDEDMGTEVEIGRLEVNGEREILVTYQEYNDTLENLSGNVLLQHSFGHLAFLVLFVLSIYVVKMKIEGVEND